LARRVGASLNLAVPLDWGEYVLWFLAPQVKVSLDGRFATVFPEQVVADNFDFFTGLPVFMMVVVGGAGFVGGALFAGIGLYGLLPAAAALWRPLAKIQTLTPGVIGISLGKQPSGAAPQFSAGFADLRDDTPVLVRTIFGLTLAWGLRVANAYQGWAMVAVMGVVFAVGLAAARTRGDRRRGAEVRAGKVPVSEVPLEWMGLTVPWTAERLAEVDRRLNLEEFLPPAALTKREVVDAAS